MYKVLFADKDAYITNRVIGNTTSGTVKVNSNVGRAGTLDLFKLYGATFSSGSVPNAEFSRLLLHFDMSQLQSLFSSGKVNVNSNSFNCQLKLFDVYGGQTTPSNFDVSIFPLSRSFSEGEGRDVVYYSDYDVCNFLSSSYEDGAWFLSGCGLGGGFNENCDFITGSNDASNLEVKQRFVTGEEDLEVDVTKIVSSTLAGTLPDSGFRLSFSSAAESDSYSYFVKRFSSRSAYNSSKHPRLIVRYDDSLRDDATILQFDSSSTLFLRNYSYGEPSNILSGSSLTPITGSNCLILKLSTIRSDGSGSYNLYFTGSQYSNGVSFSTGIYSSTFLLNQNDSIIRSELLKSGSVKFTPIWGSLDGSTGYLTGSDVYVQSPQRSAKVDFSNYVLSTTGLLPLHRSNEEVFIRLNIFDYKSPSIKLVKQPIELPGLVLKNAYYQVRDYATNEEVIPFDDVYNSTRISSDDSGMYFTLDMSSLSLDRSYVIDFMIVHNGIKRIYKAVSNVFNVSNSQIA